MYRKKELSQILENKLYLGLVEKKIKNTLDL